MKLFVIYNKKLEQFHSPLPYPDEATLKNDMYGTVNADTNNDIKACPANFAVYEVGEYSPKNGTINAYKKPKLILECASVALEVAAHG